MPTIKVNNPVTLLGYPNLDTDSTNDLETTDIPSLNHNMPIFARDASDTSLINVTSMLGASTTLRFNLSDENVYTATSPITCDIDTTGVGGRDTTEAVATGLWHIFAVVNTGTTFGLVASQAATPGTDGPPSHSIYRYLWTIRVGSTGPTVIDTFAHVGDWYMNLDYKDSDYVLLDASGSTIDTGTWEPLDGTAPSGGGGPTTNNITTIVPANIADMVKIQGFVDLDLNDGIDMAIGGGNPPPFTPTGGGIGESLFISGDTFGAGSVQGQRHVSEAEIPFTDNMISFYLSTRIGTIDMGLTCRGYRNKMYSPVYYMVK